MFKKIRKQRNIKYRQTKTRSMLRGWLQIVLAIIFVVTVTYAATTLIGISSNISHTVEAPENLIRLQLVDASGENGQADKIAKALTGYSDHELEIEVVELDRFDIRKIDSSVIISRERNTEASALLAHRLGINNDDIVYKPLDNNVRQISATLVIGRDFTGLTMPGETKETQKEI